MKGRKSGFTLVEIMIVVLIIGILLAIAIPNFMKARETSRKNSCIANMKQLDAAAQQWAMDKQQPGTANVTVADLTGAAGYIKSAPNCPSTGTAYAGWTVETQPVCPTTVAGHVLP